MENFKKIMRNIYVHIKYFLKEKKHIYVKPLFILMISLVLIFTFVFVVKSYKPKNEYKDITMDFSQKTYNLEGTTIVLDPGHGGEDPGAPSYYGKDEAHTVYQIAEKLERILTESGAKVIMTRGSNETVSLDDRAEKGDIFISLHSDAFVNQDATGFTAYYLHDNQEELATILNESMDQYALLPNKGVKIENYQVIRQIDYPGTLLELGYLSNDVDDLLLNKETYQDKLVSGIVEGINKYVNRNKN